MDDRILLAAVGDVFLDRPRPDDAFAGMRDAFVAVASFFPEGYQARLGVPGLAPLRAQDMYLSTAPGHCAPGVPPRILSVLDGADAELVEETIADARGRADVVVVSAHWGDV